MQFYFCTILFYWFINSILSFTIKYINSEFFIEVLNQFEKIFSISSFLVLFTRSKCCSLSAFSFFVLSWSCYYFYSPLIWLTVLIGFRMLRQHYFCGINLIGYYILSSLYILEFNFPKCLKKFLHLYSHKILIYNSFLLLCCFLGLMSE